MENVNIIFTENMHALRKKNPVLADSVLSAEIPDCYAVLYSKNGNPVLKTSNITFHSLYDPVKEGLIFVESHIRSDKYEEGRAVIVFGLGFAYHIKPMLEKNIIALVIEPRIEVLRLAMENVDLKEIIEKMDIQTNKEVLPRQNNCDFLWIHQPSAKHSRMDLMELVKSCRISDDNHKNDCYCVKKNSLKIIVVSPIYGGSLPIAHYCYRALKKLGHDVQLWDASIFEVPFKKALELNLDERNKKVLHDLFQHIISEMIVATCSDFSPDMVLAMAQAPVSRKALERFKEKKITTAFWFVEDYQIMDYWREYAPFYDLFFTIQEDEFTEKLLNTGAKNVCYLPLAADTEIHHPLCLNEKEMEMFGSDISFMGAGYYNRQNMFVGLLDFDFKIWGTEWNKQSILGKKLQRNGERLSTDDTVKVFNATKINLNLHSSVCHEGVSPFGDFVNPRTFEIASCGSFQLVDYRSMINRHFENGEEIVCYRSLEELRDNIQYYLKHSNERKKISQQSRKRILKEHTYKHRMEKLLSFAMEKSPECFYRKTVKKVPYVTDIKNFTNEYPEVGPVLEAAGKDGTANLDDILSVIKEKGNTPKYHEAIFILINDFNELIREHTVC